MQVDLDMGRLIQVEKKWNGSSKTEPGGKPWYISKIENRTCVIYSR